MCSFMRNMRTSIFEHCEICAKYKIQATYGKGLLIGLAPVFYFLSSHTRCFTNACHRGASRRVHMLSPFVSRPLVKLLYTAPFSLLSSHLPVATTGPHDSHFTYFQRTESETNPPVELRPKRAGVALLLNPMRHLLEAGSRAGRGCKANSTTVL